MKQSLFLILVVAVLFVINTVLATSPEMIGRNMEITCEVLTKPEKIGDILSVICSFTLYQEEDTLARRIFAERDSVIIAKAYLSIRPEQELVSGDSVWWGEIEYDKTYTFEATYKVLTASRIIGTPSVEICLEKYKSGYSNRRSLNSGNGFIFYIEGWDKREEPKSGFDIINNDTIFISTIDLTHDTLFPSEIKYVNTNPQNYSQGNQDIHKSKKNDVLQTNRMLLDFSKLNNGDTVEVPVIPDSTLIIFFKDKKLIIRQIYNRSDAEVIQKNPGQIEILLDRQLNRNIVEFDIGNGKVIFLKLRQMWMIDGTFYFDDPFGTNNNPVKRADCFLFERVNDHYEQADVGWTTIDGYFYFWTDMDTVAVLIRSSNENSFVFYADDNCFDFSFWEQWPYHMYSIAVENLPHYNYTVPSLYTTIPDTAFAVGAFHIQNIISYANSEIGFPNLSSRVPIYFNNLDSCVTQSDFSAFAVADVPGIRIRGDVGGNNMDQWDSSVVLHELGHFYQHDVAQMAPNSAGSHVFYDHPDGSNIDDLALA